MAAIPKHIFGMHDEQRRESAKEAKREKKSKNGT